MSHLERLIEDTRRSIRVWWQNPRWMLRLEYHALKNTLIPHDKNNHLRKFLLLLFSVTWVIMTLVIIPFQLPYKLVPYFALTLLVLPAVGRMWGIEYSKAAFGPVEIDLTDDDE